LKKVLILTYYWPPSGGAGVQRWLKFVKHLRSFGWEPVVYTALNGEMPVIDKSLEKDVPAGLTVLRTSIWEPYSIYKTFIGRKKTDKINASFLSENKKTGVTEKISVWIRGNFFIPDARKFWIKPSIKYLSNYIQKYGIKHVISSGPPHSMHMIALGLKKELPGIKWVADFRDPWTNIDFYQKLMLSKRADRLHHKMELDVLKNADLVLSIGEGMNQEFIEMYHKAGEHNSGKFRVITNGYDEDDVKKGVVEKDYKFSIAHIGTLVKDRNPEVLWKVLARMVKQNPAFESQLEIKLVGKIDIFVKEKITEYGLDKYVNKIDYLPHDEVIFEQQKSRVLLLLVNNTKNAKGILTGKFFEYLAAKAPILGIGPPDGDLALILEETGSGLISDFDDEVTLENNLLQLFSNTTMQRNEAAIEKYSRKNLTKELADCLNSI
jgi:glycosyltransferase involved in cell wall biosynthesis